jgi:hypothetical protein
VAAVGVAVLLPARRYRRPLPLQWKAIAKSPRTIGIRLTIETRGTIRIRRMMMGT